MESIFVTNAIIEIALYLEYQIRNYVDVYWKNGYTNRLVKDQMNHRKGPIKGLGFAEFADYHQGNNGHMPKRVDEKKARACLECPHADCIIGYMPNPKSRRCPLEEHLYRQNRLLVPGGYITSTEAAEKAGINRKGYWNRLKRGQVPGAIRHGRYWLVPVEVVE